MKTLKRTKQCNKCPWKVSTNPFDIPNGYCEVKHNNLEKTIAKDTSFWGPLNVMECHHSNGVEQEHCIGWMVNQLGVGNNIGLRLSMIGYDNRNEIEVYGDQYESFKDTLPN